MQNSLPSGSAIVDSAALTRFADPASSEFHDPANRFINVGNDETDMTPILDCLRLRNLLEYERCRGVERANRNPSAAASEWTRRLPEHGAPEASFAFCVIDIQSDGSGLQGDRFLRHTHVEITRTGLPERNADMFSIASP